MKLYKSQVEALDVLDTTKESKGIIQMATGTGKTYLAAVWFKRLLNKDSKANLLFICHNRDILKQANDREFQNCLKEFDLSFGYYDASRKNKRQVTFATVQTLYRNLDKFDKKEFDYIVVDECHHYKAFTFEKALSHFRPKFMLGLSATAYRADGRDLEDICGKILYKYTIHEGNVDGILSPFNYYWVNNKNSIRYKGMELKGTKGDEKVLNREVCKPKYDKAIMSEYEGYVVGVHKKKKTICFCVSVKHTERMVKVFNDRGIKAVGLTGKTNVYDNGEHRKTIHTPTRERIINDFSRGKYDVICVVDLFNEGVDIPDADCIMMIRPTYSSRIFTQQIGRGLRKAEGKKDLLILDFTASSRWCSIVEDFLKEALNIDVRAEVEKMDIEANHSDSVLKSADCDAIQDKGMMQKDNNDSSPFVFESLGCSVILSREKVDLLRESIIEANRYSFESLKELVLAKKKELGRTPFLKELGIRFYHFEKYSSYSSFLQQIGVKPNINIYSKEEIQTMIRDKAKELGRTPKFKELGISTYHFPKHSGYIFFLNQLGLKPNINKYTKSELENIIRDKAKELGRTPTLKELGIYPYHFKPYSGFSSFLQQMGGKPNNNTYTKEELERIIKDKMQELGMTPTPRDLCISHGVFKRYGSYIKFLKIIDVKPYKLHYRHKYSFESLKELVLAKKKELGKIPTMKELGIGHSHFKRFGSYPTLLKQMGFKPNINIYSKKELKNMIKNKVKKLNGKTPTLKDLNIYNQHFTKYGGYVSFLKQIELKPIQSSYTKTELIKIIKNKVKELGGRTPTNKELGISQSPFKKHSGYISFLNQLGLKPNINKYTKSELEIMIRDKKKELGRTPTLKELGIYPYHFKPYSGFSSFLQQIGVKPNINIYSKEEIQTMIRDKAKELGRTPTMKDIHRESKEFERENKDNIIEKEDYISEPNHGYRSLHYLVKVNGVVYELQFRTPRQTRWADYAHETLYKNQKKSMELLGEKEYETVYSWLLKLSDHFHRLDTGKSSVAPKQPESSKKLVVLIPTHTKEHLIGKVPKWKLNPD